MMFDSCRSKLEKCGKSPVILEVPQRTYTSLWKNAISSTIAVKRIYKKPPTAPIVDFGKTGNALSYSVDNVDTSKALNIDQIPPPSQGNVTHFSIELVFDQAVEAARVALEDPSVAVRVLLECQADNQQDWTKVFGDKSESFNYTGLKANTSYTFRCRLHSSTVTSSWSMPVTMTTDKAPYTGRDLHRAIIAGDEELARVILDSGDVSADSQDTKDNSALTVAGLHEEFDIAEMLLESGADINRRDASGKTPLIQCASRDALEAVKFLCGHECDVNIRDRSGMAALHHAVDGGYAKIVDWMLSNSAKFGFDVEQRENTYGMTPINRCATMTPDLKAYEVALSLQLHGARMSSRSDAGLTPLMNAVLRKKPRLVDFFLARGVDIDEKTGDGKSVYELARSVRDVRILRSIEDKIEQNEMRQRLQRWSSPKKKIVRII